MAVCACCWRRADSTHRWISTFLHVQSLHSYCPSQLNSPPSYYPSCTTPGSVLQVSSICQHLTGGIRLPYQGVFWNEEAGCFVNSFAVINNIRYWFHFFYALVQRCFQVSTRCNAQLKGAGLKNQKSRLKAKGVCRRTPSPENANTPLICTGLSGSSGQVMITGFSGSVWSQLNLPSPCRREQHSALWTSRCVAAKSRSHLAF